MPESVSISQYLPVSWSFQTESYSHVFVKHGGGTVMTVSKIRSKCTKGSQ